MANQIPQPDAALHTASHLMQYHDLIESIVAAMDARDAYTAKHSDRVADMVLVLATALDLSEDETTIPTACAAPISRWGRAFWRWRIPSTP